MMDPYRTLGLEPGASMAEVKRAYRLLAKAYHPDSAGEAALPRFLAIHEAYEAIRTGRPMAPRRRSASPAAGSSEPWRADPDRARAAREEARRRASAGGRPSGTSGASGRTGSSGSAGPRTSSSGGPTGPGGRGGSGGGTRTGTSGEARGRSSASSGRSWSGASWYGPSTGEYWIINPREYADPRKHGPEYQSRARRMAAAAAMGKAGAAEMDDEL